MILFRIQHPASGLGPFQHASGLRDTLRHAWSNGLPGPADIPGPWRDVVVKSAYIWEERRRFAYLRLPDVKRWWPGQWKELLLVHGFHVYTVETDDNHTMVYYHQAAYDMDYARVVSWEPPWWS